jgi:hypothetical protein
MSENREPANADMDQAIPGLVADTASGTAEGTFFFYKKFARSVVFL